MVHGSNLNWNRCIQSDILLVDEDLAWHHSSAATSLWSCGFDIKLFAEVYAETKKIISRTICVTYHLLITGLDSDTIIFKEL